MLSAHFDLALTTRLAASAASGGTSHVQNTSVQQQPRMQYAVTNALVGYHRLSFQSIIGHRIL